MDTLQQAQNDGVVIGLKNAAGVVDRLDIDQLLLKHPNAFNLFCLALSELMNDPDSTKIMGYFQVAGIHGLPKELWDGIDVPSKEPGSQDFSGYCAHSSLIFPTWHRPYLAMIEQTIYSKMVDIAGRFPAANQQMYKDAAQRFRLPYFDYYRPRGTSSSSVGYDFSIPQIFVVEQIMLRTPDNNDLVLQPNPLHLFNFPKTGSIPQTEWDLFASGFNETQTQRYPASSDPVSELNQVLNSASVREAGASQALNMISDPAYATYASFATDSASEGPAGSLEGIHNNYHVNIGGQGGHMSEVPVAAFDPIFWLHHCQIDRWFATWQAAHPGDWFTDDIFQNSLLPFRASKDASGQTIFWNSIGSTTTDGFGYTYPDVGGNAQQVKDAFVARYTWQVRTATQPNYGTPPAGMQPLDLSTAQVYQFQQGSPTSTITSAVLSAPTIANKAVTAVKKPVTTSTPKATAEKVVGNESAAIPAPKTVTAGAKATAQSRVFTNLNPAQVALAAERKPDESKIAREWYVDHIVERLALNGTFTIYFFLGGVPADSTPAGSYALHPYLAGKSHVFVAPREACDNCGRQAQQGHLVTNTAPITPTLLDRVAAGELESLSKNHVLPYLVKNLNWKVIKADGEPVNPWTVAGLKIGVSSKLTPIEDGGEVTYEEFPDVVTEIIGQHVMNAM